MSYQVETFRDLIAKYPTWQSFQEYLTSPEGGQIRCVGEGRFQILRYVKNVSDLKVPHVKWMRSVIWDTEQHLPVCIAPPKAERGEVVTSEKTGSNVSYPLVQGFLDGIMINVFKTYDNPNTLQIATRTQLGANGKFYSEKTFEQMFEDALFAMGSSRRELLNLLANPTEMVPNHFASFVLQHPEHRVVSRIYAPRLYLVHTGSVHDSGLVSMNDYPVHWPVRWHLQKFSDYQIENVFQSEKQLSTFFADLCKQQGWFYQGITIKDMQGRRWRMRNPNYMYLRTLRGSEASAVERFLRLRSENKVTEYLKHYAEDRQTFWDLEQKLRKVTQEVFLSYCQVHKSHEKKLEDLPWAIRPCVFKLHSHYLEQLRPNNEKVSMKQAVELVNNLALYEQKRLLSPPPQQTSSSSSATTA